MLTLDYDRWDVRAGEVLLDLGCGKGRHTFEALGRGLHVVSVDLDLPSLKETRATTTLLRDEQQVPAGPRSAFVRATALKLPFADGVFDRVVASEVLEHIRDDGDALAEITRVLRPGGGLAVTVPRFWPERVCWMLSRQYHSNAGGHVRIYRTTELVRKIQGAGCRVVDSHFAHAFHSPYWWLKCLCGIDNDRAKLPALYHRFLLWDLMRRPRFVRAAERVLDPVLGKSVVLYASKARRTRTGRVAA